VSAAPLLSDPLTAAQQWIILGGMTIFVALFLTIIFIVPFVNKISRKK